MTIDEIKRQIFIDSEEVCGNTMIDTYLAQEYVEQAYNKAIDDFAEKLKAKCNGMIKDKWNSNVAPISWAEAYADFKDDIDDIAEQLKVGIIND